MSSASESPLFRLHRRKFVTDKQFAAGEKLREDFEQAHLARRVTTAWEEVRGNVISDNHIEAMTGRTMAARRRVQDALDAVGPELAGILYYVCCLVSGIEVAERMLALPGRAGKAVLGLALTRLARHYRLIAQPQPNRDARAITSWGLHDFRPELTPSRPPT
jgi:Domain of unknown function (DUF6456)